MRNCQQCGALAVPEGRFCAVCGAMFSAEGSAQTDPLVGRVIGGSYTIQEIVGVGGMGRVYRAEQSTLGRTVAVKVVHPHLLGDEQSVARFYTEARASSRLNHPNSVGVIDFGRTEDGILYLVMEFLKGHDLARVMEADGPLPFTRITDILIQVLDALGEAHALEIVHRDLKPENIIIRRYRNGSDVVKVVDFGLATIVDNPSSVTRPGLVCGTPDYMAPEQARGEHVDGRGDLYALGVMLYELLAEELPFVADTPTKVVLKHIADPVPDPRVAAPHREIPDELALIAMKALAKRREDRFRDANDMQAALRRAREALAERRRTNTQAKCAACGATNPFGMRFCGACGQPFELPPSSAAVRPRVISFLPVLGNERPLVGRGAELDRFMQLRAESKDSPVWIRLEGEPGVGKSRFLTEVSSFCAVEGDLVVGAGPHPTGAPVAYHTIRTIVSTLLGQNVEGEKRFGRSPTLPTDPLARAGLDEISEPRGLPGTEGQTRVGAVASALATSVRVALGRATSGRVVVLVDDFARCDWLSQQAMAALGDELGRIPFVLVTVGGPREGSGTRAREIVLGGLDLRDAQTFLGDDAARLGADPSATTRRYLPLYLESLQALGEGIQPEGDAPPPRLADAILQRVDRLGVGARRILQAASVLGSTAPIHLVRDVAELPNMAALEELTERSLVSVHGDKLTVAHPFLAELVEASIPASARRALHERAMQLATESGAPIEVIAEHAYRAREPMRSLIVLERMGDVSLRRGDAFAALLAYRRALELARRETLETGDSVMDTAVLTFSRKLGDALAVTGDLAGADGVLREAMDLTGAHTADRAKMYLALGRLAMRRQRARDAMRHFGLALELVAGENAEIESRVQLEIGRLRRSEGDARNAANAYRRAIELFESTRASAEVLSAARIELGAVLLADGLHAEASEQFIAGERLAGQASSMALAARAVASYGELEASSGREPAARMRYERAAHLAAEAGDAPSARLYRAFADGAAP